MSKFSAPFPQAHLIYIYQFHSETKSYTITFAFSYILSLRCLIGVEKQRFWKKRQQAFRLISVYVQLCFDRYVTKWLKFIFCVDLGLVGQYGYLEYSLQGWIKILDRLAEFSCDRCIQTKSENHLEFSQFASESKITTHAGSHDNNNTWNYTSVPW